MPGTHTLTPSAAPSMPLADIFTPGVGDELETVGVAFGDLVQTTGSAIADIQNQLNLTGAATAQALANTLVDVIAVEETVYDEFGNVNHEASHTYERPLPLINFIDPVFYEWSHVRLQGQFYAQEIVDSATAHRNNFTSQFSTGQHGLLVFFGGGQSKTGFTSTTTDISQVNTSDVSIGRMRMNAMLRPRTDVTIPKPTQVIQGPNIIVMLGPVSTAVVQGFPSRLMNVSIQYMSDTGTAITGKELSVEADGLLWDYVGPKLTDASGLVEIQLVRTFPDEESRSTEPPASFVLSVRKGMVANDTTVQI